MKDSPTEKGTIDKIEISDENETDSISNQVNSENDNEESFTSEIKEEETSSKKKRSTNPSLRRRLFRSYKIQEVIKTGQLRTFPVLLKPAYGSKNPAKNFVV